MKKKVFSFILASLLLLVQLPTALAAAPTDPLALDNIYTEASNVINIAIQQGIVPGLSDGEISDLYLGESIPLYEVCSDNTLAEVSAIRYFPVLDQNNSVRGLFIASLRETDSTATLEYNSMLSEELTLHKLSSNHICFIFDQTDTYLFDGTECSLVLDGVLPHITRGTFSNSIAGLATLDRNAIVSAKRFDLATTSDPAVSGMLSVPIITQDNWSNGCWAACAVSVGEYVGASSEDITIDDVMAEYANGQDVAKTIYRIQDVLAGEYNEASRVTINSLKMTTIIDNIGTALNMGTPVVARVSYSGWTSGHFVVVCGFTSNTYPTTSYVSIMDPLSSSYRTLPTERVGNDSVVKYTTPTGTTEYGTDFYLTIS